MHVARIALLAWVAVSSLAAQDTSAPVGVAASQGGQICVAMPAPELAPGAALTLIQPTAPQSVFVATVVRPVPGCERLDRAMISGPYYLLQLADSTAGDFGGPFVALSGMLATRRIRSGEIAVQLSAAHPNAQVRSCTSSEGLHLTVWVGTPLTSQRLWHQYYYLGYDLEPSCDERDARVSAAPAAV